MNEPITLFDFGLYQLEKYFEKYPFDDLDLVRQENNAKRGTISSDVSYDWDRNILIIQFSIKLRKKESVKSAKDLCINVTNKLRTSFVFNDYFSKDLAGLSRFFKHIGFSTYTQEQERINRITEIEKIIYIKIDVLSQNFDDRSQIDEKLKAGVPLYTHMLTCESPLLGKDIYYVDRN